MATIYDLFEVSGIFAHTTYSEAAGNLLGVVDGLTSTGLDDGEFDQGDSVLIGGVSYTINLIQEPASSGRFTLGDGTDRSFDPGSESNLSVVFLTVSNGTEVRYFIIPNDSYGDMNVQSIRTGEITNVAGSDAATISTFDNKMNVVCFVAGTHIETSDGPVRVEDLRVEDRVLTLTHGHQAVRMILNRHIVFTPETEKLKPICLEPGSLGPGRPNRPLCVSPQHRILVVDEAGKELLVPAKSLTDRKGVRVMKGKRQVTYFHLVFDRHEIILSDGTPTESFFPGPVALATIPPEVRNEVLDIFFTGAGSMVDDGPIPAAPICRLQTAKKAAGTFHVAPPAAKKDTKSRLNGTRTHIPLSAVP